MAHTNYAVTGVRTVYLPCRPELGYISSRFVREIAKYGGAIDHLVPAHVADALRRANDSDRTEPTMSYDDGEHDDYDDIDDEYPDPRRARRLRRRRRDAAAPGHRHHRHGADHAAVVVAAHRPRRDHRAARGVAAPPARGAAPGPLDAQGAPGVRRQDPPRGRRTARGRPGAGRAHGAAHRGRARRRAAGPPGDGDRRGRLAAPASTRPRTSSTSGSARSRSCSTSCRRPSAPAVSACRSAAAVDETNVIEEDDPTKGFFDQDH